MDPDPGAPLINYGSTGSGFTTLPLAVMLVRLLNKTGFSVNFPYSEAERATFYLQ